MLKLKVCAYKCILALRRCNGAVMVRWNEELIKGMNGVYCAFLIDGGMV